MKSKWILALALALGFGGILVATGTWRLTPGAFRTDTTTGESFIGTFPVGPTGTPAPSPVAGPVGSVVLRPYTWVGRSSVSSATWAAVSLSTVAADSSSAAVYRFTVRNEGAGNAFYLPDNATTTPVPVGITLTANTPTDFTQFDNNAYDTKVWVKNGASPEKVWVEVWKQ